MAMYLSDSTVVTCMRAGLYQTKNGLLVFFGSLRSRKSMTLAEISSSTVFERSSVSGPSSLQVWFAAVPSDDLHQSTGRGGVRHTLVAGIHGAGNLRQAGNWRIFARWRHSLIGRRRVDVREAHALHRVEVIEIAPEFVEAVRGRQSIRVVASDSCRTRRCCSRDRAGTMRAPACRVAGMSGCPGAGADHARAQRISCR